MEKLLLLPSSCCCRSSNHAVILPFAADSDEDRIRLGNVDARDDLTASNVLSDAQQLLLSFKAVGLCNFSYKIDDAKDQHDEQETRWEQCLQVDNKKVWRERRKVFFLRKKLTTSLVVTGTVRNVLPGVTEPIPFIAFRGTQTFMDMMRDLQSISRVRFKSKQGKTVGYIGKGFRDFIHAKFRAEYPRVENDPIKHGRDIYEELLLLMDRFPHGLIVTGHSLGGAAAASFMADFATDHAELLQKRAASASSKEEGGGSGSIGVHCITFGAPRVYCHKTASKVEELREKGGLEGKALYNHWRYANDGDIITAMPPYYMDSLYHVGTPIFANEEESKLYQLVESKHHNFAMDIIQTILSELDDFIREKAGTHVLGTSRGYGNKFVKNETFLSCLNALEDSDVKSSFEHLLLLFRRSIAIRDLMEKEGVSAEVAKKQVEEDEEEKEQKKTESA